MGNFAITLLLPFVLASIPQQEIALNEARLKSATVSEKAGIYLDLALAHLAEQELESAITYFFSALHSMPLDSQYVMGAEEKLIFDEAFSFYVQEGVNEPQETAKKLIDKWGDQIKQHQEWHSLKMLIATAYANLEQFDRFFRLFYQAYPHDCQSYLSLKTQGILLLRLSMVAKDEGRRGTLKREAVHRLREALNKYKKDPTLYRLLFHFAKEMKEIKEQISLLEEMVNNRIVIPRSDLYFYVKEACDLGDIALAEKIVTYAEELYEYSRGLTAARDYVKQRKRMKDERTVTR